MSRVSANCRKVLTGTVPLQLIITDPRVRYQVFASLCRPRCIPRRASAIMSVNFSLLSLPHRNWPNFRRCMRPHPPSSLPSSTSNNRVQSPTR